MDAYYDLVIIGGGASGFFAALAAKEAARTLSVALVEKEEEPLRKLLASGNGRCNLVNLHAPEGHYQGQDPSFALSILQRFPASRILDRFQDLGLLTLEDREGRVYPRSFQSLSVAMVLKGAAQAAGIDLIQPATARELGREEGRFQIRLDQDDGLQARALIVAAGSQAAPDLGGSSRGYQLLASLGHPVWPPLPAQVPLTLAPHPLLRHAQGVRFRGRASFEGHDGLTAQSQGEFLITSYGLSGIAAMDLGRTVARSQASLSSEKKWPGRLTLDFLPEWEKEAVLAFLKSAEGSDWRTVLAGLVADKVGRTFLTLLEKEADFPGGPTMPGKLAGLVKGLDLEVKGTRGFPFAYVASGGVETKAFDPDSLMSKTIPGLFACGEVLDVDGDTGGFNLHWAFASGWLAGKSAAAFLETTLS